MLSRRTRRRRILALALSCAIVLPAVPLFAAAQPGTINGIARSQGKVLANYTVQGRNAKTGQLAGSTTSNASGALMFTGLSPADYVIEIVDAAGNVVGTSPVLALAAGATMTVTVDAAAIAAASAAAAGGASFFGSTLGMVSIVAAGVGITGIIIAATRETASGSQ